MKIVGVLIQLVMFLFIAGSITLLLLFLKWVKKASSCDADISEGPTSETETEKKYAPPPVELSRNDILEKLKNIMHGKIWEYDDADSTVFVFEEKYKKLFAVKKFRSGNIALQYLATVPLKDIEIDYSAVAAQWLEENHRTIDGLINNANNNTVRLSENILPAKEAWTFIADKLAESFPVSVEDTGILIEMRGE